MLRRRKPTVDDGRKFLREVRFPEQGERGFQPKMNSPSEAT
jgi:hypothetical protein